ncbi:L,D-transpeptidase family protein [Thiorhodococcus mannitoliphagus]|uniref:L,D-transpeptidase family protein n=1 Tax=Thiorhodococcus mannitoliphagus TaxID=329406 RepID=A0A6P1DR87_9GAMM|nr:L,D-transpeptidase family protein [Thiorhodococcus mannitoliphagus]NEX19186.1 L,D-transpeptidase family protein [Thiorhodococcus mannitoliphagus]
MSGLNLGKRRTWLATFIGASLIGWGALNSARAETFRLDNPGDSVVGVTFYFKARQKDTLLDIARQNNLGYDDMRQANPKVDMWVPGADTEILVPAMFVLPDSAPREGIVINRAEKRLYYYPPDKPNEVRIYTISVGKDAMGTPLGSFDVIQKRENPTWTPGPNVRAAHEAYGDILPAVVPPGPDNPLGRYAIRLSRPDYLIHGTSQPWGIGMEVSGGCIRMYPEGVEELYPMVELKTPVNIIDQPYKVGWRGSDLYLEVQTGEKSERKAARQVIPDAIANDPEVVIDWGLVEQVVEADTGIPQVVGHRRGSQSASYLPMIF